MSNIHGLSSFNNRNDDDDNEDENNRYVGGVSSRGGGSGLAVEPNPSHNNNTSVDDDDILGTIRSNAEEAQPPSTSSENAPPTTRRMITMYRSGFTVDNGPFRRLDDPSNTGFLRDLARGITPRELFESSGDASSNGDMEVGLVDKRHMEYEDDTSRNGTGGSRFGSSSSSTATTAAFSGVGQSLGGDSTSSSSTPSNGVINPSSTDTIANQQAPVVDESKPTTTIQIRLLNRKRLIVKCNLDDAIQTLVSHIEASGDGGGESYVLSSGYPPKVLDDLSKTIEECGLKGAQVIQKKA